VVYLYLATKQKEGRKMKMREHVTVVGALHIGLGALGVLVAIVVLASTIGPGLLVLSLEGDAEPLTILTIIGGIVAVFLTIISLPGIIGGIGLLRLRPWARILVLIVAVLDLLNIPIGTLLGIYSIWVLVQDETVQLFASRATTR
jgi:hypothetical protein